MCIRDSQRTGSLKLGTIARICCSTQGLLQRNNLRPSLVVVEGSCTSWFDCDYCGVVAPSSCHPVSYTHLRAHETVLDLVCRLLLEKKIKPVSYTHILVHSTDLAHECRLLH
eukprot:TRINITY_DN30345_c0_g1_i1.p2 TRINITY_DN30345_c0_g1~~TRINITY_DN30345_c0_g1_i1.p2  ORF type:complete len:112 (-),score=29.37 TRINITY_DN30345_c0_g1_i1:29-364(-)